MSISEKLTTIAQNEQKVYDAGKKSQYDEFWDEYQQNGKRTDYRYAFAGEGWNEKAYTPKYPITLSGSGVAAYIFSNCMLEKIGNIDMSKVTGNVANVIRQNSLLTEIGEIVLNNNVTQVTNFFYSNGKLITIKKLKFGTLTKCDTAFYGNESLTNIIIEGVIAGNINFQHSPLLSKESLISIINALSKSTSSLTVTFSKDAVNSAFGIDIDDETTYPEGSEYYTLRNTKSNWTFNYI